jgi:hypothetical protein
MLFPDLLGPEFLDRSTVMVNLFPVLLISTFVMFFEILVNTYLFAVGLIFARIVKFALFVRFNGFYSWMQE